ncbi:MAG: hypothetical protein H0V66_08505 [Bdellovibrionales bacterium]|nr:hypothetical protein [Bdellovibrionales bacterium]
MEDTKSFPFFRKIDQAIFERIDKFKQTTNYNPIQDFYNGLEEEQQKLFKGVIILGIFLLPLLGLTTIWWQNNSFKEDLAMRTSIVSKANEIIGQSQGLQQVTPEVFSSNPIDSASMMTSRLSTLLSSMAIDLSKIQVNDFVSESISSNVMKAEANFAFTNVSTDEMVNILTTMISREKFRVSSLEVKRNSDTNLLQGKFHAIHYSTIPADGVGEE